jgi:LPS-assembly lipoprotein
MSSFRHRRLAVAALVPLLLAPLGGCGFQPLYAKSTEAEYDPVLASIKIERIPEAIGQHLQRDLEARLNPRDEHVETRYVLHVTLGIARSDLGISRSATAARSEVHVTASYYITTAHGDDRLYSNSSTSSGLFNILDDGYATQVAYDAATVRAVDDVSRDIEDRLVFFARRQREHG